jgi:type IV secretion system protein VirD4
MPYLSSSALDQSIRALATTGRTVEAIKLWREHTGDDLPTAKAGVESLLARATVVELDDTSAPRTMQATARFAEDGGGTEDYAPGSIWLGRNRGSGAAVGFEDNRHVVTIAGSRSGKGTSAIVPNLCDYPGSIICIDPKGENATVTARRRDGGSPYCHGIGQQVVVLDPFRVADVPAELRGTFNPLDSINVDGLDALDEAQAVAEALVVSEDPRDMHWSESAKQLIAAIVLFAKLVGPEGSGNLRFVRVLLTSGVPGDQQPDVSGFDVLLQRMRDCKDHPMGAPIAAAADTLLGMGQDERGSVLSFARRNTAFLDSPRMQAALEESTFSLAELKTAPAGCTLYLCLPVKELASHGRWLRLVVMLALAEMERLGHGRPATGHPVLFLLDEFASLGYMRPVEVAAGYIAGYGVKLWPILQDLQQLQGLYPKSWATFLGNAGVLQCFANTDPPTLEYLSKRLGETELRQLTASESSSKSQSQTTSQNWSQTRGNSVSQSIDKSVTRNPRGIIFRGKRLSETSSKGSSSSSDTSSTQGGSNDSSTTQGIEQGVTEVISVVPLLRPDEIELRFSRRSKEQLIIVAGERPLTLLRSEYQEDEQFTAKFDPHPAHPETAPLTLVERQQREMQRQLALAEAQREDAERRAELLEQRVVAAPKKSLNWIWWLAPAALTLIAVLNNRLSTRPDEQPGALGPAAAAQSPATAQAPPAPSAPPETAVPSTAQLPSALAVAAISANLRAGPTERDEILVKLPRATRLLEQRRSDGRILVRTDAGQVGWLSDKVVMGSESVSRLERQTPQAYVLTREPEKRIELLVAQLQAAASQLAQARKHMLASDPVADSTLRSIDAMRNVSIAADADASTWFGWSAKHAEGNQDYAVQAANAHAAIEADPASADHWTLYGMAAYRLGRQQQVAITADVLQLLAPLATNTWVLVGIADATSGKPEAAASAFVWALRFSRNPAFTRKFLVQLADSESDVRVSQALRLALAAG